MPVYRLHSSPCCHIWHSSARARSHNTSITSIWLSLSRRHYSTESRDTHAQFVPSRITFDYGNSGKDKATYSQSIAVPSQNIIGRCGSPDFRTTGMAAFHPVRPISGALVRVGFGASRAVRAAKAERRLWVPKRSAAADNYFWVRLSATCSAMCRETRRGRLPPSLPDLTAAP